MAGEWIKMRTDLREDPTVFRLAELLGIDELHVVGCLFCFWAWVDKHAVDGHVDGATSRMIDKVSDRAGFADAMVAVGWLVVDGAGVQIPKFDRHNGESAKERSLKNARQAKWRAGKDVSVDSHVDAEPSTQPSTREEKRREDISTPLPPSGEQRENADRGKRLPDDWGLEPEGPEGMTADVVQAARDLKAELDVDWGLRRVRFELDNFRDYWHAKAGRTATKTDWLATWRTWLRKAMPAQPAADPVRRDIQAAAARTAQAVPA